MKIRRPVFRALVVHLKPGKSFQFICRQLTCCPSPAAAVARWYCAASVIDNLHQWSTVILPLLYPYHTDHAGWFDECPHSLWLVHIVQTNGAGGREIVRSTDRLTIGGITNYIFVRIFGIHLLTSEVLVTYENRVQLQTTGRVKFSIPKIHLPWTASKLLNWSQPRNSQW